MKKLIGGNIKAIREQKRLNRPDIERNTNGVISASRLSNYETGLREPDIETIIMLARALKTSVNKILEGIVDKVESDAILKPDRQDIHDELEALPAGSLDAIRLAIELVKFRKPRKSAEIIHVSAAKKGKQKK